jgi:hypothetical protein
MSHRYLAASFVVPFLFAGCAENPAAAHDHEDELSVELTVSPGHAQTLSEVTFAVGVTDRHGKAITDFDTLRVEHRLTGSDGWRGTDLMLEGGAYTAPYTFYTSGAYDLRVVGLHRGHAEMAVLHRAAEPLHVRRAHVEAGGYRVEFESFPGHIHEGDTATLKFWVLQAEKDASGNRPPVGGLAAEIHYTDASGAAETHPAVEAHAGVYETDHAFRNPGDGLVALRFTDRDGAPAEAGFPLKVAHEH